MFVFHPLHFSVDGIEWTFMSISNILRIMTRFYVFMNKQYV